MTRILIIIFLLAAFFAGGFALYWLLKPADAPVVEQISSPTPQPIIKQTPEKENFERDAKLQAQTDALLPLFGKMPRVSVYLKDEIVNKNGSETERGVAYTACENRNQPTIFIKKIFYQKANQKQLTNILKHELTHAYFCQQGTQAGHDERFRKKFKEVGGFGN